eukprot:GFUD01037130.1.p1 GENE.GFUD01037130.1~~GFUD01037130.1.p1  ORF type:complete len:222 (+),score=49.97 GFUD01037130.1:35-700(+)
MYAVTKNSCVQHIVKRLVSDLPCTSYNASQILSKTSSYSPPERQFHLTPTVLKSKQVTIFSDLRNITSTPPPALTLGLAGLIPFISAPLYMYNAGFFLPDIAAAQLTYGATILSFLGGVRWGLLVQGDDDLPPSWSQYSWSVTPSLLAWSALLVPNLLAGYGICSAGLLAAAVLDLKQRGYPAWFRGLRFLLSFCAILSLVTSIVFTQTLGTKKHASDYLT